MRTWLKDLVAAYGSVAVTIAISAACVAFSAGVTLFDMWLFGHDPVPAIYLATITPAIIAPPVTFVLVRLVEQLDAAERRVLEREGRLSRELDQRERTNRPLAESEERFRNLIEGSIQGILIHRRHMRLFVNRAWAAIHGYTQDEILNMDSLLPMVAPSDRGRLREFYAARLRGEDVPSAYEYRGQRKDGTEIWLDNRVRVVNWDGEPAVQSTLIDISERVGAEEARHASEERHRRFAADVAHELRTPLAVMRANLDSLEDGEPARSLQGDVDAMARMVEQLLAVSRLESLALEEADEADLHAVCTSVPVRLAPLAVREERSIEVTGSEGPVLVRGDPGALEQAVRNLVENAIRYSARRTTVTIEIGADASIRVIDHGRGIPAELRNTVFERFQRADRRAGGAGLGLSIVRRTVEGHDGSIEVGEAPGGGTVFTMRLPPMNPRLL